MKKYLALAAVVFLAACNTVEKPPIIVKQPIVVKVPSQYFMSCKLVPVPSPDKLTNGELAGYIIDSHTMNKKCVNALKSIKDFLNSAEATIQGESHGTNSSNGR